MKLVVIESPYAGNVARNEGYARECMRDCLRRGEAPFASHLLYTQVLRDVDHLERAVGMQAGFAWGRMADICAVYQDLGISNGMKQGIAWAMAHGVPVEYRQIYANEVA